MVDSPFVTLLNKRIRNLKKKLRRINQLEEQSTEVIINKEQEHLLKSKQSVVAVIEELQNHWLPLAVQTLDAAPRKKLTEPEMKAPAAVEAYSEAYVTPHEQTLMEETVIWTSSQVFLDKEIGRGSNGTVVYLGEYPRGRPVAVKCLSEDQYNAKIEGYNILRRCGIGYAHIVRLFAFEEVGNSICAIVSLCDYDLNYLVRDDWLYADLLEEKGYPKPHLLELMRNIADGLRHLHACRVIYGDLNPSHVLIDKFVTDIAKLSMVGSCRRLAEDETSLRSDATVSGTPGWRTPEQILDLPQTQAMDVFNLGCVFFFLLTQGKHPFGESSENNVADNNIVNLYLVERIPEAKDLISRLLEFEPQLRPKASEVLHHPLFWDSVKRLSFLRDASVRVNGKMYGDRSIGEVIERGGKVFHGAVKGLFNSETIILEREQDEPFCSVNARRLLHLVQIKVVNMRRTALEKKLRYLSMMEELDHYLRERFPNLLMGVYDVMLDCCKEEGWFEEYLP